MLKKDGVMHHDEVLLPYPVDLQRISTPREQCLMLISGPVDVDIVNRAEANRFDHLPVLLEEGGALCGLVDVEHARLLVDEGRPLTPADPTLSLREVEKQPPLSSLLTDLAHHGAVIFRDRQSTAREGQGADWFALVTKSDLNRHPFRAQLYPILAELEALLAELIDRWFEDPWTWLPLLSEHGQVQAVGRWELEKRNRVDTSPITGCTLTDMTRVVSKSRDLRDALAFTSRNGLDDFSGAFSDLRNQIMHPVRPLVLDPAEVRELQFRLSRVLDLTRRVSDLNQEFEERGMPSRRVIP